MVNPHQRIAGRLQESLQYVGNSGEILLGPETGLNTA